MNIYQTSHGAPYLTMNICFFGIHDPEYPRTRIIISGFKANGYNIIECRVNPTKYSGFKKFIKLYEEYRKIKNLKFEYVFVTFPGQPIVWLAFLLFGKRIIFDAHVSLYDSNVFDRKIYSKYSLRALKDWLLDWYSCLLAKKILLDTNEHIEYFVKTFHVNKKKFIRVLVGADDTIFMPQKKEKLELFTVHFHGTFIPLQGIQYIIKAAHLLKKYPIQFNIIGSGRELFDEAKKMALDYKLTNIYFLGRIPFEGVSHYINKSNVCLGIFGDTSKTLRVIPNKAYECIAMGIPVITAESRAIKEVFTDNENIVLCKTADEHDLAEKILYLMNNKDRAEVISKNGLDLFKDKLSPAKIGEQLIKDLK